MKALVKVIVLISLILSTGSALSGTRDGYFVLVVDLDAGNSTLTRDLIEDYFNGRFPNDVYECNTDSGGRFELSYLKKRPKAATNFLITSALSGKSRDLQRIQRVLRNYKDAELLDGFDFLLAFKKNMNGMEIAAVSAGTGIKIQRQIIKVDSHVAALQNQRNVSKAICELSGAMPFVVAP